MARLVDPKAASVLESLLRVLLVENGLAPDRTQYPLRDTSGNLVAWVDFAYLAARLLVEADGFEFHRERADYRKDRRRATLTAASTGASCGSAGRTCGSSRSMS